MQTYSRGSRVGFQLELDRNGPGFHKGARIDESLLDFQVAEIGSPEALCHAKRLGMRMALAIESGPVVEAGALDDQGVAIRAAYRVSHACGVDDLGKRPAIQKDFAVKRARNSITTILGV